MPGQWQTKNNFLEKAFVFKNFKDAINFVRKVAKSADKVNHHPDILIHSYKQVLIKTRTHEQNKITPKDYELAELIDKIKKPLA